MLILVIGFAPRKVVRDPDKRAHRNFGLLSSVIEIDVCVAWCCTSLHEVAWHARPIAWSIRFLRSLAYSCGVFIDVDAVGQGKMWDRKTSEMSQSLRAALNAFGLFASWPLLLPAPPMHSSFRRLHKPIPQQPAPEC